MILKIGCCGIPKGFEVYSKNFCVAEIQTTFYNLPNIDAVKRWLSMVGKDFEFIIKAWQLITHPPDTPTYRRTRVKIDKEKRDRYGFFRPTPEVLDAWNKLKDVCDALNVKIIVFQTPASFTPTDENIENIMRFIRTISTPKFTFVWEPRGDWLEETLRRICRELNIVHCVDPFATTSITEKFAYFRLHGSPPGKKMYSYNYTKDDLKKLYDICKNYETVYCMFNNVYMYENALEFNSYVRSWRR